MQPGDVLILKGQDVRHLLQGQEARILDTVRRSYEVHRSGLSFLPHSTFLSFPNGGSDRVIALPAYLGGEFETAGVKWISSFSGNIGLGMERASAVVILNSTLTGRPEVILEGSLISAKRTAASAALAAVSLHPNPDEQRVGLVGCGAINFEIIRFLRSVFPNLSELILHDLDRSRSLQFAEMSATEFGLNAIQITDDLNQVFEECALISLATTATQPHVFSLADPPQQRTILHISLRDLAPEVILSSDNVVDDADHVCRARTSLDLAAHLTGDRAFIRCSLADVLVQEASPRASGHSTTIFSPFGLGILDLAVGKLACELAQIHQTGTIVPSFLPDSWTQPCAV